MRFIFVSVFCFCFVGLYAQRGNSDFGDRVVSNAGEGNSGGDSLVVVRKDTLSNDVYSFSLGNLSKKVLINDSLLTDFEEYEMTNQQEVPFITLGNPGSSTAPMFWNKQYYEGFRLGFDQYRPYQFSNRDIKFYSLEKPYSKVYFSPGSTQASFRSSAVLARDFAKNTKVSVHFNRINSAPTYDNTEVRHTYFHAGVFQKLDSTKFAYSVNFVSNSNFEEFNGGIVSEDDLVEEGGQIRSSIDVLVDQPYQYNLNRDFSATGYYFISDQDTAKQYLQVSIDIGRELYKFINEGTSTQDTLLFTEEFIVSPVGMRRLINNNTYAGAASYHIENKAFNSRYYLKYRLNRVTTDLTGQSIQTIVGGTENQFDWRGLSVNLDGYAGTSYSTFLLDIHPRIRFQYKTLADIQAGFRLHTEPSSFQFNQVEITEQTLLSQDPFTISSQELYGAFSMPFVGFYGKVSSFAGQNVPVLSADGTSILRENITYLQIDVEEKIKYRWFRFNNRFITQIRNTSIYSMPAFYTEHEMYLDGELFGSLGFNVGVNVNFVPSYGLPAFSPFYARYYASATETVRGSFYRLDPFASIKVQGFNFFVKYEFLNDLWQEDVIFQSVNNPQLDGRLRLGVSWVLRN